MNAADVLGPIAGNMAQIDALIRAELNSDVVLINQLGDYLIGAGGKRLRPALVVMAAQALDGSEHAAGANADTVEANIHCAAAIVEFIHSATLLHDDVVDDSDQRRGRETANAVWGNAASVLTGDFLYSRAFQMMVRIDSMPVMQLLAETTNRIAEGEVLQLLNIGDPNITEARYFEVIERKTAVLFGAAAQLAGIICGSGPDIEQALYEYGRQLGIAFQLVDDALDYAGDAAKLGKNVGDDLAEGKPTLPLLHVLANGDAAAKDRVRAAIADGGCDDATQARIIQDVTEIGSIEYTFDQARKAGAAARTALRALPESDARTRLDQLVDVAIARTS